MRPRVFGVFALCCALLTSLRADDTVIRLCADQWMPYNGDPAAERPGYVVELARVVFAKHGLTVDYSVVPWTEALAAVKEGRMAGAIGANQAEGKGLVLPKEPVGSPTMLLMTRRDSTWTYDNVASLRTVKLGVIEGYSYWPGLDSYVARQAGKSVTVVSSETPLADLVGLLAEGKIDVLAESEPVLLWHLRQQGRDRSELRAVYRHQAEPVFIAFSPTDAGRRWAALFDQGVRELRASGELEKLLQRYGLHDWQ